MPTDTARCVALGGDEFLFGEAMWWLCRVCGNLNHKAKFQCNMKVCLAPRGFPGPYTVPPPGVRSPDPDHQLRGQWRCPRCHLQNKKRSSVVCCAPGCGGWRPGAVILDCEHPQRALQPGGGSSSAPASAPIFPQDLPHSGGGGGSSSGAPPVTLRDGAPTDVAAVGPAGSSGAIAQWHGGAPLPSPEDGATPAAGEGPASHSSPSPRGARASPPSRTSVLPGGAASASSLLLVGRARYQQQQLAAPLLFLGSHQMGGRGFHETPAGESQPLDVVGCPPSLGAARPGQYVVILPASSHQHHQQHRPQQQSRQIFQFPLDMQHQQN